MEIGPGTGNLTMKLLPLVNKVIAIEVDPRMVAELQKRISGSDYKNKLEIIYGDAIKTEFPYFDVCVANTPYQISSPLTFKLLAHRPIFREALLMFQREFALRLVAQPSDPLYCRLSVNTQLLCKPTHVMKVGKNNFRPPPKVESSIIRLKPHNPPPPIDFLEWDGLLRIVFSRKNKTMAGIFKKQSVIDMITLNYKTYCSIHEIELPDPLPNLKEKILEIIDNNKFTEMRSNKMEIDDFLRLLDAFNSQNIHFS